MQSTSETYSPLHSGLSCHNLEALSQTEMVIPGM